MVPIHGPAPCEASTAKSKAHMKGMKEMKGMKKSFS
jgi:hypothetical protein